MFPPFVGCGVLVTGGSSGIGRATAQAFARQGASVVSAARREHHDAADIHPLQADLSDPVSCASAVEAALAVLGRLDVVIAAAGAMVIDEVLDARTEDWTAMAQVNLVGTTSLVQAALPHLVAASTGPRRCADLIIIGSMSGRRPTAGRSMYAATKAALRAFSDVVRQELASTSVRVSLVEPGLTATGLRASSSTESLARMSDKTPELNDVTPLSPEDVADAVTWVTSRPAGVSISELAVLPTSQGA